MAHRNKQKKRCCKYKAACGLMVTRSHLEKPHDKYLTVQNGAEEVGFVDLLTGRQNHIHLVVAAEGAGVIEIYSTQLLHTRVNIHGVRKETICDEHNHHGIIECNQKVFCSLFETTDMLSFILFLNIQFSCLFVYIGQ